MSRQTNERAFELNAEEVQSCFEKAAGSLARRSFSCESVLISRGHAAHDPHQAVASSSSERLHVPRFEKTAG